MSDRKRLKEAIKSVIRKEMKGKGIIDYDVKPAVENVSYENLEGGATNPLVALAKFIYGLSSKKDRDNLEAPVHAVDSRAYRGRGNFEYEIPEFDEDPEVGSALVAHGIKDAKVFYDFGKALFDGVSKAKKGKGLIAEGLVAEGMKRGRKKKGGLVAEGLVAEGMKKKGLIGLAYRDPKGMGASASLPYSDLYGESLVANGYNYDKQGMRKKGAPRGDKGEALRKFNAIIKELRSKDPSMSLPEARAKAKAMYRS